MAVEVIQEDRALREETPRPSKYTQQLSLSAGVAASFTVPANVDWIRISYTAGTLWMRADGSAAVVPAATISGGTGSEIVLQGDRVQVDPGQVLSFINATACVVVFACKKCRVVG